ncbi:hypothetical protein GCK72_003288 [Caenorhabditis remanei]|uniref:Uncharacterized protein n=1 Tax=Caenorhabditis remanei TaxID=31234 RepID=A0A6A5HYQ5_CAERE|nr:hypothetical protein GCK72_003288 [Caenorhabditis remanei]KAF1771462.1 hypothetical protein GCK72_003288 [Caenorhabditis remanei]
MSFYIVTSDFITIVKPCTLHSFHPLTEDLSVQFLSIKEEKRDISLDFFMDADKFSLLVNKKHRRVINEVLFPELPEEVEENTWKCFGSNEDCKEADDIFPRKTAEKLPLLSNNPQDSAANSLSSPPFFIDTSIPPPSFRLPVFIDTSVPPPSFLTPPTSGPASPSLTAENPSFAFNMGVANAPKPGFKVAKKKLSDSGEVFEMYVDTSKPKKVKVFSPEEIKKQESLVDEWKRKIQNTL